MRGRPRPHGQKNTDWWPMRKSRTVRIVEYDPNWQAMFREAMAELSGAFQGVPCAIEHIGSTAVTGLCAKPVTDIMLGTRVIADVEERIPDIEILGYAYVPELEEQLPERRFFRRDTAGVRTHHLHAVAVGGEFWRDHILFRDQLRSHPDTARAYGELKRRLAKRFRRDPESYTASKSGFIRGILAVARGEEDME